MNDDVAIASLSAIAHATRLGAFRLLVKAGPDGVPAGEIARTLGVPPTTMSTHLSILTNAGLIEPRRESRTVYYSLRTSKVSALFDFLMEDCCQGRPELCGALAGAGACDPPKPKTKPRRRTPGPR